MSALVDKERLLSLMRQLVEARGEAEIRDLDKQIKDLLGKGAMGYRSHESGLINCQSAVFYLDNVVENLTKIVEDLGKTAKKLGNDGQSDRSLNCVHLVHSFTDLSDKVTGIRNYINRGL